MSSYTTYSDDFTPEPFGLRNVSATCWLNSLFQMLLGMPALNKVLLENEQTLATNQFATEYINVVRQALGQPNTDLTESGVRVYIAFMRQIKSTGRKFTIGQSQECADEAFTLFIDLLGCPEVERLFSNVYELTINCVGCNKTVSTIRDHSYRIAMFTVVPLDNIEKFSKWLRIHPSECEYFKCDCGHVMSKFHRTEKLKMLRECLVIVFNKFQMKDRRWFPKQLEFPAVGGTTLKYKLVGCINHSGNASGGHYQAATLRGDEWYNCNDTSVTPGSCEPSPSTFMVAYCLVE